MRYLLCACALLCVAALPAADPPESDPNLPRSVAGPMLGHAGNGEALVWVALSKPGDIELRCLPLAADGTVGDFAAAQPITASISQVLPVAEQPGGSIAVGTARITGLQAGQAYQIRWQIAGSGLLPADPYLHLRMPPAAGTPATVRIAIASCAKPSAQPKQPVWGRIAALKPDAMLSIGDTPYLEAGAKGQPADWADPARMAYRHFQLRSLSDMTALLTTTPNYGIWDDHDFGPNDSDRTFAQRDQSHAVFEAFWANGAAGGPAEHDGIYHSFRCGPVEVWMCDDRAFRDPPKQQPEAERRMLGTTQMAWLQAGLKASAAQVKLVVGGGQWLADYHSYECWNRYPAERQAFFDWLAAEKISGVIFVSGDRHLAELLRMDRPGTYPLYDFTTSAVAAGVYPKGLDQPTPMRVWGYAKTCNFGVVEVSQPADGPASAKLLLYDDTGTVAQQTELDAAALGLAGPPPKP